MGLIPTVNVGANISGLNGVGSALKGVKSSLGEFGNISDQAMDLVKGNSWNSLNDLCQAIVSLIKGLMNAILGLINAISRLIKALLAIRLSFTFSLDWDFSIGDPCLKQLVPDITKPAIPNKLLKADFRSVPSMLNSANSIISAYPACFPSCLQDLLALYPEILAFIETLSSTAKSLVDSLLNDLTNLLNYFSDLADVLGSRFNEFLSNLGFVTDSSKSHFLEVTSSITTSGILQEQAETYKNKTNSDIDEMKERLDKIKPNDKYSDSEDAKRLIEEIKNDLDDLKNDDPYTDSANKTVEKIEEAEDKFSDGVDNIKDHDTDSIGDIKDMQDDILDKATKKAEEFVEVKRDDMSGEGMTGNKGSESSSGTTKTYTGEESTEYDPDDESDTSDSSHKDSGSSGSGSYTKNPDSGSKIKSNSSILEYDTACKE